MTLPEEHFKETKRLISLVGDKLIADWLIKEGYYAEQYVLPPCFWVFRPISNTPVPRHTTPLIWV